jgi:predicted ATPase
VSARFQPEHTRKRVLIFADICHRVPGGRLPLCILPGFEVDIGYHVLCLFKPAKKAEDLQNVNSILTKLGLAENQRFQNGQPQPLRANGCYVSLKRLLETVQDEQEGIVIAAHADQHDGILNDTRNIGDYRTPDLMAVEVTAKPIGARCRQILQGKNEQWSRTNRQPAYVMSSDAKSLQADANGKPLPNSLGYRHTWIRMSRPSTEALRQAFLDPRSRLRVLGDRPSSTQTHPRIISIAIRGAKFLDDQEIYFSENLNCVIGGRGSGKSSVLEYLRFAIKMNGAVIEENETSISRKRRQLRESIASTDAEIRIHFQAESGVADTLVYVPSNPPGKKRYIEGRDVEDIQTVLNQLQAQFFGQGELSRITDDGGGQARVLALIDASSGTELSNLQAEEHDIQSRLKTLFQARHRKQRLMKEIRIAKQEATELERQLNALKSMQADFAKNQRSIQARRFLDDLVKAGTNDVQLLEKLIESLGQARPVLPDTCNDWPETEWFKAAVNKTNSARHTLLEELNEIKQRYIVSLDVIGDEASKTARDSIQATEDQFMDACNEKGIQPADIVRLQELEGSRQSKLKLIEEYQQELKGVERLADGFPAMLSELHSIWKKQFDVRQKTAKAIEDSVASKTVHINISFMSDKASFQALWMRLEPKDGRGKLARRWDEIGGDLYHSWHNRKLETSPWETLEAGREDPSVIPYFYELAEDFQPILLKYIDSEDVRPIWEAVRIHRISDGIDVELLREDGTSAGAMSGELSEGQRNTLLLNLILSRGTGPLIIDQPEDELDSSFIYQSLVGDMRVAKEKRQLIVATHSANLPVNADAELIFALAAQNGRGKSLAKGGLDRTEVTKAVLDIMEGSEQAFKQRGEKYRF